MKIGRGDMKASQVGFLETEESSCAFSLCVQL